MKVGFGCDHTAVELKTILMEHLQKRGFECIDYGTMDPNVRVNYPDFGLKVAEAIKSNEIEKGVLVCGTGVGISLAANKVPGIRAAVCSEPYTAKLTVEHNDANIIAMGARVGFYHFAWPSANDVGEEVDTFVAAIRPYLDRRPFLYLDWEDSKAYYDYSWARWFLDAVCEHIWEVVPGVDPGGDRPQIAGHVEIYDGSYAAYTLARAERMRQADVAAAKRANLLTKELAWLRRGAPARTSKPKFHIAAAEALIADVPPPRDTVALTAMATARLGKKVLDLEDVTVRYPGPPTDTGEATQREVLRRVTWRLAPGERVGVVGVNGAGKTTLLRLLEGVQEPTEGRVARGKTVQVATLSQSTHELDALADLRVVEAVAMVGERVVVGDKEMTAAQLVERLGFTRQRAWTRVGEVSGGERRRLQLLRLLMTEPNVLLLDEPTNDLDTETLASLEEALLAFPGCAVITSHDRWFMDRVATHILAWEGTDERPGAWHWFEGNFEDYQRDRERRLGPDLSKPHRLHRKLTRD